jgi:hypothetical protein
MTTATYIKKSTLGWADLWGCFGMEKDAGGRWYPTSETQGYVKGFLEYYRSPSHAWPHSYSKPMLSQKFAKLVVKNEPKLAVKLGIAEVAA